MMASTTTTSPDASVHVKVSINGTEENRKFKLALKDLGAAVLPDKLRSVMQIPSTQNLVIERFSDSSASFVTLDSTNPSVYKQLYRAAKAKGKLRLRATITGIPIEKDEENRKTTALPERLISRAYVPPYISDATHQDTGVVDSPKASEKGSSNIIPANDTPSSLPESKPSIAETGSKVNTDDKPYFWPISNKSDWSQSTKSAFDKQTKQTDLESLRELKDAMAARIAKAVDSARNEVEKSEAPVPHHFSARDHCRAELTGLLNKQIPMGRCTRNDFASFTICCNVCDGAIPNTHWHCSICDNGDFDLCQDCVDRGHLCDNGEHWLIKRSLESGKVVNSTSETIAPKRGSKSTQDQGIPGAFEPAVKTDVSTKDIDMSRTCNSCVQVFDESKFVTCLECEDYDLCIPCHVAMKHGHQQSHEFAPASKDTVLTKVATALLGAGRNARHWAICDGCNKDIYGIRHKCLQCPDWDYCSGCAKTASVTHPHRFAPLHDPILNALQPRAYHEGVFCDGPLCKDKVNYIRGDRYKCAVCHDTDFCASCEALPHQAHNSTHPLIKFKTPIRNVQVSTFGGKDDGTAMVPMGDQTPQTSSKSTETNAPVSSANAATQVHTIADVAPTNAMPDTTRAVPDDDNKIKDSNAYFLRDTIADGSTITAGSRFKQVWTLGNPGPYAWPAGCGVSYIGGDSMLDVDPNHPSHITQIRKAIKTNIVERAVQPGEEVDFEVTMRAPEREGSAISYWRLKSANGTPFGHKLWCDIVVKKAELASEESPALADQRQPKVEDNVEVEAVPTKTSPSESQMIMPKLDKESPVASTHEAETKPTAPVAAPAPQAEEKDLLEDVESLELDNESSDEGFLTDEEYELVASDNDMEEAKNGKK